ncbi:hypothetical protein [Paenibacillus bouchesdurhonensis]|uniref:hypothetical protein n=1 Tax=Paenibacillus bouchesdurhonensis TaxID=1870990 RepID=UPI000DA6097F|nr:hypothetical protein [Paenibacillus bouchesdurhonensis]
MGQPLFAGFQSLDRYPAVCGLAVLHDIRYRSFDADADDVLGQVGDILQAGVAVISSLIPAMRRISPASVSSPATVIVRMSESALSFKFPSGESR